MQLKEEHVREALKNYFGKLPLFYLKFTEREEWAKDILEGKLYMNNVRYYRELEEKIKKKGQGDINELKLRLGLTNLRLVNKENEITINFGHANSTFTFNGDENTPIFCLTGITVDDMIITDFDYSFVKFKLPYTVDNMEQIKKDFGRYIVLLHSNGLETAIQNKAYEQNLAMIFDKVKYCDVNNSERVKAFNSQSEERFLYKDLEFKYQKEYRLALDTIIQNNMIFNVGSLEGIGKIFSIEEFLNLEMILECEFYEIED